MTSFYTIVLVFLSSVCVDAFLSGKSAQIRSPSFLRFCVQASSSSSSSDTTAAGSSTTTIDPEISAKFKILTCSSTSCAKKRQSCGLDSFATYAAFYGRINKGSFPNVQIEESPCLGACEKAPCVGIQHDDFVGNVALEGMNGNEFTERVFHSIITEDDADRVWSCVENAIHQMAEEEEEDDDDYEELEGTGEYI